MLTKLLAEAIKVNTPVEWPVYSSSGRLLLQPGQSFKSEGLIEALLWRGIYRGNETTFASGQYEKIVNIEQGLADGYEKVGQNHNEKFSNLEKKQENRAHNLPEKKKSINTNDESTRVGGERIDEPKFPKNNPASISESEKQVFFDSIKNDVLKLIRVELKSFFEGNVSNKIQEEINKNVYQDMQKNVISKLGNEIDIKIKKQFDYFIEHEYERDKKNPINRLIIISSQLELIYSGLEESSPESINSILTIANNIQELCVEHPDAMLMSVHLYNKGSYTIRHPIDMAILCELISLRQGITDKQHRQYIVAAALTCDFSMRGLQKSLQTQSAPLTDVQHESIGYHSVQSVALLLAAGVMETVWLDTVAQHHERIDGSGYPLQYTGDNICEGAKILAISDRYCSMVTGRTYHNALHGKDALSVFLTEEEALYDKNIVVMLISELSIYPPGTFVQLDNGEYAVVIYRGVNQSNHSNIQPIVLSFADKDKKNFTLPLVRKCNDDKYKVKGAISWDEPFPISPEDVWDLGSRY